MIFRYLFARWLLLLSLALSIVPVAQGAGTITNCNEVALRRAIIGGGIVTCNCDGVISLTNTIVVTNDLTLQAPGHIVEINGGNRVRLFVVNHAASLTINHINLLAGLANPTNSPIGVIPGSDGGAIYNDRGNLIIVNSTITGNLAVGQTGTDGDPKIIDGGNGQDGGAGRGGAIFNNGGVAVLSTVTFLTNKAVGGTGGNGANGAGTGNGPTGGTGGTGGNGSGAAIFNANGATLIMNNSTLSSNQVIGAVGGIGGIGTIIGFNGRSGYSGDAIGGALVNDGGQVTILDSTFAQNIGQGASPTNELPALRREEGVTGRNGGNAFGGAIFNAGGRLAITNSTFFANALIGGNGGPGGLGGTNRSGSNGGAGGSGGMSEGGALYNSRSDTVYLVNCTISDSIVAGGLGGVGGLPGGTLGSNGPTGSRGGVSGSAIFSGLAGTVAVGNTILNQSLRSGAPNIAGVTSDLGGNLNSDASLDLIAATSRNNISPGLGALTNNGGSTPTMAISSNSPAVDAAVEGLCLPYDQRGFIRFGLCDIGAYEYGGSLAPNAVGLVAAHASNNGSMVISWRSDAIEYQLVSSTNLSSGSNWTPAKTSPAITNGFKSVTISATNQARFFELSR